MPKPSDVLTDDQIHQGLNTGEYQGRDALVAEEILRRRHEERVALANIGLVLSEQSLLRSCCGSK